MKLPLLFVAAFTTILAAGTTAPADAPDEPKTVKIAGLVLRWVRGDKEANFRRLEAMIRAAADGGAKVVVTTECALDGYAVAERKKLADADWRALGEPIPSGAYFKKLAALAKELKIYLIAGLTEADGDQRYNTVVIIGPDGQLVGKYRKQNLGHEAGRNTPGALSSVFPTPYGKVGVMICADRTDAKIVKRFCDTALPSLSQASFNNPKKEESSPSTPPPESAPGSPLKKFGEKNRCPECGNDQVRAMSNAEMRQYFGTVRLLWGSLEMQRNPFVLSAPRKCEKCGHGYEIRPTRAGCVAMMLLSALVVLPLGLGLTGVAVFGIVGAFLFPASLPSWFGGAGIFASVLVVIGGAAISYGRPTTRPG